jgi:hypothetical protein
MLHNPKGYEGISLKAGFGEPRRDELLEEDQSEFGKYNPPSDTGLIPTILIRYC